MKILTFLGALLLATTCLAGSVAHEAKCPPPLVDLEKQFWVEIVSGHESEALKIDKLDVDCAVLVPPLSGDDFKKMAMIMEVFTLYPDVAVPWTEREDGNLYIVRGSATDVIRFVKIIYSPRTGNMVLSRAIISLKED